MTSRWTMALLASTAMAAAIRSAPASSVQNAPTTIVTWVTGLCTQTDRATGKSTALLPGESIAPGALLHTGPDGALELVANTAGLVANIHIGAQSSAAITPTTNPVTWKLNQGEIVVEVPHRRSVNVAFAIQTADGSSTTCSGTGRIGYEPTQGRAWLTVESLSGALTVQTASGRTVIATTGSQVTIDRGSTSVPKTMALSPAARTRNVSVTTQMTANAQRNVR